MLSDGIDQENVDSALILGRSPTKPTYTTCLCRFLPTVHGASLKSHGRYRNTRSIRLFSSSGSRLGPSLIGLSMRLLRIGAFHCRNASVVSVASLATLCHVVAFLSLFSHASGAESIRQEDHNHPRILDHRPDPVGSPNLDTGFEIHDYVSDFHGLDRSIIGRVDDVRPLHNNVPGKGNIAAGDSQSYTFSQSDVRRRSQAVQAAISPSSSLAERGTEESSLILDGSFENWQDGHKRRQTNPHTLYVTLNMCDQPRSTSQTPNGVPLPLQLYISTNTKNPKPTINNNDVAVPVDDGLGSHKMTTLSDVFFTVIAPAKSPNFDGLYSYELTASTDTPYTTYINKTGVVLVDSDKNNALLSADGDATSPSYSIFVHNQENPAIRGLLRSFCGLKNQAQIQGNINGSATGNVEVGMMSLAAAAPTQHFYVNKLNGSSSYYGIMAIDGDAKTGKAGSGIVGGGGTVWSSLDFATISSDNCAVIFNLSFCSDVAYAVPSNLTSQPNLTSLRQLYDSYAQDYFQNFTYSLQQIPCNTTSSAQYSLAKNCADCEKAYKTWLCAVTIPRCEDFSNNASFLQPRAVSNTFSNGTLAPRDALYSNSSRNPMIDQKISPGPYNEILPCVDLCYDLIQSCPASLKFACPIEGHGLEHSYGERETTGGEVTCNYPGAAYGMSGAMGRQRDVWFIAMALLMSLGAVV